MSGRREGLPRLMGAERGRKGWGRGERKSWSWWGVVMIELSKMSQRALE